MGERRRKRLDFEVGQPYTVRRCRSCGAEIVWIVNGRWPNGKAKRMPLEFRTRVRDLFGNLRMESHYAYCPDAPAWRSRSAPRCAG